MLSSFSVVAAANTISLVFSVLIIAKRMVMYHILYYMPIDYFNFERVVCVYACLLYAVHN